MDASFSVTSLISPLQKSKLFLITSVFPGTLLLVADNTLHKMGLSKNSKFS